MQKGVAELKERLGPGRGLTRRLLEQRIGAGEVAQRRRCARITQHQREIVRGLLQTAATCRSEVRQDEVERDDGQGGGHGGAQPGRRGLGSGGERGEQSLVGEVGDPEVRARVMQLRRAQKPAHPVRVDLQRRSDAQRRVRDRGRGRVLGRCVEELRKTKRGDGDVASSSAHEEGQGTRDLARRGGRVVKVVEAQLRRVHREPQSTRCADVDRQGVP